MSGNERQHPASVPIPELSVEVAGPTLSIVVPAFNEEENLEEVTRRVGAALVEQRIDYELVFVNDGSTDGTAALLRQMAERDRRVKAVTLARNFGHQAALTAGLACAGGRAVVVMDADLQDPPELIPEFVRQWQLGNGVVYGVRRKRKEGLLKRLAYHLYYRVLAWAADVKIPLDSGDFCLMDRQVVDLINALPERGRFVRGLRAWSGLRQIGIEYERASRRAGAPKYSFRRLVGLALEGIVSFSVKPLHFATMLGFLIAAGSVGISLYYFGRWTLGLADPPAGFLTVAIGLFFLFGVQFILIGIVGAYVGSIHTEVKGRPLFLIEDAIGFEDEELPGKEYRRVRLSTD